ncbi:MAG TPA: hypothetical protein VMR16_03895 [Candidatus Saccharimonadales bacterium]|nr:hypothetical protein [Candidatus Saccharimonadales bacterium]
MTQPQRLPLVNGDDGAWGDILNQYLNKEHYQNPVLTTDDPANGGHETVTLRPGTNSPLTAPLKFTSGSLMITPETGAVEFSADKLYFTQTTSNTRNTVAAYDDTHGAQGDLYYRDASGNFIRLGVGSNGQYLTVSGGAPAWDTIFTGTSQITVGTSAPGSPTTGDLWIDTN